MKIESQNYLLLRNVILGWFCLLAGQALGQDDRSADHEALRELRATFVEALNNRDFEAVAPLLTDSFTFTTVNNRKLNGAEEMRAYWAEMFDGDMAVIDSMTVSPDADNLTEFLGDGIGVAQGTSHDVFEFRAVGHREMKSRWTAVVRKIDGLWKIALVHMSGDILDNPVLNAQKSFAMIKAVIGSGIGVIVGLLLGILISRRKMARR